MSAGAISELRWPVLPPRKVNFTYCNIYYIIFHIVKCVCYCRQFAQILCRISLCVFCCNYGWQLKRKRKFFLIIIFVNEYLFNIQSINVMAHNDLYVTDGSVFPGFSFGVDVRLKRFSVQYSRQCVSPAASANMFTVELMIGKMIGR